VQIGAVDGYDPMLGIMHYEREGSPAFVFDLMEPERPKVDRAVLAFLESAGYIRGASRSARTRW
jgi:CRISPR-associated protein Cas1